MVAVSHGFLVPVMIEVTVRGLEGQEGGHGCRGGVLVPVMIEVTVTVRIALIVAICIIGHPYLKWPMIAGPQHAALEIKRTV